MKTILFLFVPIVAATGIFFAVSTKQSNQTVSTPSHQIETVSVPYQAAFAIYTNGTLRQFSSAMYLNQSEDVFLEERNPNIIQVKKEGLTWQEFFDTLPFTLTPTCLTTGTGQTFCSNNTTALRFFLNGTENPQVLQQIIQPKDRVLISYGVTTAEEVVQQYKRVPVMD